MNKIAGIGLVCIVIVLSSNVSFADQIILENIQFQFLPEKSTNTTSRDKDSISAYRNFPEGVEIHIHMFISPSVPDYPYPVILHTNSIGRIENRTISLPLGMPKPQYIWFEIRMRSNNAKIVSAFISGTSVPSDPLTYSTGNYSTNPVGGEVYSNRKIQLDKTTCSNNEMGMMNILYWIDYAHSHIPDGISLTTGSKPMPNISVGFDWFEINPRSFCLYNDVMSIKSDQCYTREVIFHEYAHAMQKNEYNITLTTSPDHSYPSYEYPEFALSEGWAEFMAVALSNNNIGYNMTYYHGTVETNMLWAGRQGLDPGGVTRSGENVEGAVMSTLWDLYDNDNADEKFFPTSAAISNFTKYIWKPLTEKHPQNAAELYRAIMSNSSLTSEEATTIRGIFEKNGIVFSRSSLTNMPYATGSVVTNEVAIYHDQTISVKDIGPNIPPLGHPVTGSSGTPEWRIQVCDWPLYSHLTTSDAFSEEADWGFISDRLYSLYAWKPNDENTLFTSDRTQTKIDFTELGWLTGPTYPGMSLYPKLRRYENLQYPIRAQRKDEFRARDSFYPDCDDILSHGVGEWLTKDSYDLSTVSRAVVDNFRPLIDRVTIRSNNVLPYDEYDGEWDYNPFFQRFFLPPLTNRQNGFGMIGGNPAHLYISFTECVVVEEVYMISTINSAEVLIPMDSEEHYLDGSYAWQGTLTRELMEQIGNGDNQVIYIKAKDYAGNWLSYVPADDAMMLMISHTDISRTASGTMGGTGGIDQLHKILIDVDPPRISIYPHSAGSHELHDYPLVEEHYILPADKPYTGGVTFAFDDNLSSSDYYGTGRVYTDDEYSVNFSQPGGFGPAPDYDPLPDIVSYFPPAGYDDDLGMYYYPVGWTNFSYTINYAGGWGFIATVYDFVMNCSSAGGGFGEADPTFVQPGERGLVMNLPTWYNQYVDIYRYPPPRQKRVGLNAEPTYSLYEPLPAIGTATVSLEIGSSGTAVNLVDATADWRPGLTLPRADVNRAEYDAALAALVGAEGATGTVVDSGYAELVARSESFNQTVQTAAYELAREVVRIEKYYATQCGLEKARVLAEYGQGKEIYLLQVNGATKVEVASLREAATREVESRYAIEAVRIGTARRARVVELHEIANTRLLLQAGAFYQDQQTKLREIATTIMAMRGETLPTEPPAVPDDIAPVVRFAEGFDGSTVGLVVDISGSISDSSAVTYLVWYGAGENPAEWVMIGDTHISPSPRPALSGGEGEILARWCAAELPRGTYTIKVLATGADGNRTEVRAQIIAGNVIGEEGGTVGMGVCDLTGEIARPAYARLEANELLGTRGGLVIEPVDYRLAETARLTWRPTVEELAGLTAETVRLARYEGRSKGWTPIPTVYDSTTGTVTGAITAFGRYALYPPTLTAFSPENSPGVKDEWTFLTTPETSAIISDAAGETVWSVVDLQWTGRNNDGRIVADGQYWLQVEGVIKNTVLVDNTAPTVGELTYEQDAEGNLTVRGRIFDTNLEHYVVYLEGKYAGEETLLATGYINADGVLAQAKLTGLRGDQIVVRVFDFAGNEATGTRNLSGGPEIRNLWSSAAWIAPEIDSPDVPRLTTYTGQLAFGNPNAELMIVNETGPITILHTGFGTVEEQVTWSGTDDDSSFLPAGRYVYQIPGAVGDDLVWLRAIPTVGLDTGQYLKSIGVTGDYRIIDNRIAHLDAAGTIDTWLTEPGRFDQLQDIALSGDGGLWVLDAGRCELVKLGPAGEALLVAGNYGTEPGEYTQPIAIASTGSRVFVLDGVGGRIDSRDRFGRLQGWGYAGSDAIGLGAGSGVVYVFDSVRGVVDEYSLGGGTIEIKDLIATISIPMPDAMVRANVPIFGMACGKDFLDYRVEYGQGYNPDTWVMIQWSSIPQNDNVEVRELVSGDRTIEGNLATWATGLTEYDYSMYDPRCVDQGIEGPYTVRLTARNQAGKTAEDRVNVVVGRVMNNTYSGTVISEDGLVTLIVPEQALNRDFLVMSIAGTNLVPGTPTDQTLIGKVYEFRPAGAIFQRACPTEWSVPLAILDPDGDGLANCDTTTIRVYHYDPDTQNWQAIGGAWDATSGLVRTELTAIASGRGYYALLADSQPPAAPVLIQPDSVTEQPTTVIQGTAEAGATVELVIADTRVASINSGQGQFWSMVPLVIGENSIIGYAVDGAGRRSPTSAPVHVTRQRIEPASVTNLVVRDQRFLTDSESEATAGIVLGLEMIGADADPMARNYAGVLIEWVGGSEAVELLETGLNTGRYRALWTVPAALELPDGSTITFSAVTDPEASSTVRYLDRTALRFISISAGDEPYRQNRYEISEAVDWAPGQDVTAEVVTTDTATGNHALRFTNTINGGAFRFDYTGEPFSVDEHQLVSFDYRMSPGTKLNLLVKADGQWYDLPLTDTPKRKYFDVDLVRLNGLDGIADGQWHTATVNLGAALEQVTAAREIEAISFADWDITGFMKLVPGNSNPQGAWFELDNFVISGAVAAPAPMAAQTTDAGGNGRLGWHIRAPLGDSLGETQWVPLDAVTNYPVPQEPMLPMTIIEVTSEDGFGNRSEAQLPIIFDTTPPQLEPHWAPPAYLSEYQALRIPIYDIESGISRSGMQVTVNGNVFDVSETRLSYDGAQSEIRLDCSGLGFTAGVPITVKVTGIKDRAGNSPPTLPWEWIIPWRDERVVISEVEIEGDNHGNDKGSWVELYCVSGPAEISTAGFDDYELRTMPMVSLAEAPVTLQTGDYAVIHWDQGMDEVDNPDGAGWDDLNGNGVRDLYYDNNSSLRQIEDNLILSLEYPQPDNAGSVRVPIDAVVWKQNPGVAVNQYEYLDLNRLVAAGQWEVGTGGGYVQSAAALAGDHRLARVNPLADTNRREDWIVPLTMTPGAANDTRVDLVPPAIPGTLTATGGDRRIILGWQAVPDADLDGYRLYREGTAAPVAFTVTPGWTDQGVTPGIEYRYRVTAIDLRGNESPSSGSVGATAIATERVPELFQPDPNRVTVSALTLRGAVSGGGEVMVQNAAGDLFSAAVTGEAGERLIPVSELENVFGCALETVDVEGLTGTQSTTFYTLQTPPERWLSSPFVNRLYFWERVDGWDGWRADDYLTGGAGHILRSAAIGLSDYTIRARLHPEQGTTVFWFSAANDNGYRLQFDAVNGTTALQKVLNGQATTFGEWDSPGPESAWTEYAVARKGERFLVLENGQPVLVVDDLAGVPSWCDAMAIDNRGGDNSYDYVEVYRGDLVGVLATDTMPTAGLGKIYQVRLDGDVGVGTAIIEAQDGGATPALLDDSGLALAGDSYRLFVTLWRGSDLAVPPTVRALHCDVDAGFSAPVPLIEGENRFTAQAASGAVSNEIVVERVTGLPLELNELSFAMDEFHWAEVLNAGAETITLSGLTLQGALPAAPSAVIGDPGLLGPGERILLHGDATLPTENEMTGDLNNNGRREVAFDNWFGIDGAGAIIIARDGVIIDVVPVISRGYEALPEPQPVELRYYQDLGLWTGARLPTGISYEPHVSLSRYENRTRDEAADWLPTRPTPGVQNTTLAVPTMGDLLINEISLTDGNSWIELLGTGGVCDGGSVWLTDLDGNGYGPLTDTPQALAAGERLVVELPAGRFEAVDQMIAFSGWELLDGVSWMQRGAPVSDDEANDHIELGTPGLWTGPSAVYWSTNCPIGRILDGTDHNIADDWRPVVPTPGSENVELVDNSAPVTTLTITGASYQDQYYLPQAVFTLAATDDLSGVAGIGYRLDGGVWQSYTSGFTVGSSGAHTLEYYAEDYDGNRETTRVREFVIDGMPPMVTLVVADGKLTIETFDGGSGAVTTRFSHVGQAMEEYTGPVPFFGAGDYQVRYEGMDRLGNRTVRNEAVTIPLDAPTLGPLPLLTNQPALVVAGRAIAGGTVTVRNSGTPAATAAAVGPRLELPISAFTERDSEIVEQNGYLTLHQGQILWNDDFNDGNYQGWQVTAGNWAVENGALAGQPWQYSEIDNAELTPKPAAYAITGRFRLEAGQYQSPYVFFNTNPNGKYWLTAQHGQFWLAKRSNTEHTIISPTATVPGYQDGAWLPFAVEVRGDGRLWGTINGATVEAEDTEYTSGSLRLVTGNYCSLKMQFDDLGIVGFPDGVPAAAAMARTAGYDLSGFGQLAGIRTAIAPGSGSVALSASLDGGAALPLYRMVGTELGSAEVRFAMQLLNPEERLLDLPRGGPLVLYGMGNYSGTVTLTEGENRLVATVEDEAGNQSGSSEERVVILDTQAPGLAIMYPAEHGVYNHSVTITSEASDNLTPAAEIVVAGERFFNEDGEQTATLTATDAAGNITVAAVHFAIDRTPPVIAGLAVIPEVFSPDGNGVDDTTAIYFTFADNLLQYPGSLKVEVRDAGGTLLRELLNYVPAAYGVRTIIWDGKNTAEEAVNAGAYRVIVSGADAAGNRVEAEIPVTVQYDVTPPDISVTSPVENASYSYTLPLTLAWTVTDTESGVLDSSATLDRAPANSGHTIDLKALGIGGHTMTVAATDNAGNAATVAVSFTVVDDVPPTITLAQPVTPTNQDVTLQYVVYDEITAAPTVTGNNSPYTAEGNYTVVLTATDEAGNQATSNAVTFTIDKTTPMTTLTVGVPSYNDFITSATSLTLAATDNLTAFTIQYHLDGGAWQEYAGEFTLTGDGMHTVGFRSTDAAGNVEAEQNRTLTVDNTAPTSTLAADLLSADGAVAVPETKITLTATDAGSGMEKIEYQVNSANWVTYTAPFELREVAGLGPVTLGYRAVDRLGNAEVERTVSYEVKPALEMEAGLLTTPRILCWWNEETGEEGEGHHPSREEWTAALTTAFDSAVLDYLIVETPAEFLAKLPDYNVYLIVGDKQKLDEAEDGEEEGHDGDHHEGEEENSDGDSLVAAQVALGKTLISFGYEDLKTPDGEDRGWENIFGIKKDGVLNGTAHLAVYPDLAAETTTLTVEGRTERIKEVLSGEVWGEVALIEHGEHGDDEHGDRRHGGRGVGGDGDHGEGDKHNDTWPAIVANNWGSGKVLYLAPDYGRNLVALAGLLANAAQWGAPSREVVIPGGVVGIGINVRNAVLPITLRVYVEASLPVESDAVAVYDNGTDQGNAVVWTGDLAAGVTDDYRFLLRLPPQPGPYLVTVYGYYSKELGYRLADTYELVLP